MNIQKSFSQGLFGLLLIPLTFSSFSAVDSNAVLIVKGKVTRGTCAFTLPDQTVTFSQSILAANVAEIGEKEENKIPFSIGYSCQEFTDETPDMEVVIKAGAGTQIGINKISPTTNMTNSSFVLYDCKNNNSDCTLVNFKSGASSVYLTTGNGNKNKDFAVEVVKKETAQPQPGALKAILALNIIQP